jgi:receptor protein-tyrosine kinase
LPAGEPLDQAVEMLQSARLAEMLNHASGSFDWIVVDSPPFAPLADSALWVTLTEGTLLVVRLGKTPKQMLAKVLDSVDRKKLLGVVMNDCEDPHLNYYAQYYKDHAGQRSE